MASPPPIDTLDAFLKPRSVAIVGASDDPKRISGRPLSYMISAGFAGTIYPVNPNRARVQGIEAYPSVAALPEAPDLAIVAVAAAHARAAVEECAALGVRGALLFTAGFAEAGAEGQRLQDDLLGIARRAGMRLAGPNCLGMARAASGLYATFSNIFDRGFLRPGPIGLVSQSGAFGGHLAYAGRAKGLGIGHWATTGNEADVSVAEWIGWMAREPEVRVIVAYAEAVRDGATLVESLRAAHDAGKPVVMMKVGRSASGARAAASHTAGLAGADAVFDAVFRQFGVHRAKTAEELLDIAYACERGALPRGNRLGLITTSGGTGVQMCDAAEEHGLAVPPMPEPVRERLQALLPFAAVGNPVDVTAQIINDIGLMEKNVAALLGEGDYDAVVASMGTLGGAPKIGDALRQAFLRGAEGFRDRLIVLNMKAPREVEEAWEREGFPVFEDAYRAVRAAGALARFRRELDRAIDPPATDLPPPVTLEAKALNEWEAKRLLAAAGVPMLPERLARTPEEAAAAAEAIGFPVVLKIVSPDILHKTEIGGVVLDLRDAAAVRAGCEAVLDRAREAVPGARIDGVLVAKMAPKGGVETIIGVAGDPSFGPVVMFGLGGVFVEVLKDVTFRRAPFGLAEAHRMIGEVRGFALLERARGAPPCDIDALAETLVRVSRFAAANAAGVESIDINPFLVFPKGQGGAALDAVIVPA